LRETVYVFPRQNVITKDNVVVEIDALIYFQITDPVRAAYEIANLPDAIEKLTQTTLRNLIGEMELDHILSSRDTINARLREILDEATHKWGAKVSRVELKDINPPRDIRDAMEKQMRAERDRRAAILAAEAEKQSRILQAEGIRQSEINKAEGEKQAKILAAEAEATARLKVAEAEAQAIERITNAIKGTGGDPARYLIAIRYIEALKEMVTGQNNKVVYLPYEATGVLSSLGGIREMLAGPAAGRGQRGWGGRARSRSPPRSPPRDPGLRPASPRATPGTGVSCSPPGSVPRWWPTGWARRATSPSHPTATCSSPSRTGAPGRVLALRDTNGDGRADVTAAFGTAGGTGIALGRGVLYFATRSTVLRYPMHEGRLLPVGEPQVVARDLPADGNHT